MRTTLAALAVFLAGPASAATVVFSGTVESEETVLTTYYSDGSEAVSDTTVPYEAAWKVEFQSTPVGVFMDGDGSLPLGGDPSLDITKAGATGEGSWSDYGSSGWSSGYTYIAEIGGKPVSGVVEVGSGYIDGYGDGYSKEVIYHLTGPAISVPEPASWAMMLIGFGTMGAMVRRKRRVHEPG